ncbi:serine hydrolase domain-containing protein [Epilithonimonas sp.]|uniref:serine hydrolase domain-containing protein n=1 Tax=Epilithonimonas sp. TaxID=2894511 RepID=UPI0035B2752C
MKTKFLLVLIILAQTFYAQEIAGSWKGELDFGGMTLPLILNIKKENNGWSSTAKSPKQSDQDISVDRTEFVNNELFFEIKNLDASYKAQFKKDHFEGLFTQRGRSFPLNLYNSDKYNSPEKKTIKDIGNRAIDTKKIDGFLDYVIANKQGVGSLSIFKNGKEIYSRSFGQDQLPNVESNAETGYQIGSISKFFTSVMLMQLAEKGKLSIDDKLSKYYPDIPNAEKISLKTMLNHTSGLGDYVGENYQWLFKKYVGDKAILDTIKTQGVLFQPGEKTRYSNSAYYLLSRILEKVAKKPYNVLLRENITSKIGMKNTFSVLDDPKNIFRSYKNQNDKWIETEDFDFHNCVGLGDITSTAKDLNLFVNALFNNKLVSRETLEKMLPLTDKPFGLGIMSVPFYNQISYGHGGDTAGTHSITSYNPKDDYSVSLLINGEEFPHNDLGYAISAIIYDTNYEFPKFENNKIGKNVPEEFRNYVGNYSSTDIPLGLNVFSKDDKLFAQGKGQPEFPLENIGNDQFRFDQAGIEIRFFPDKKQMQLKQNGKTFNFTKD